MAQPATQPVPPTSPLAPPAEREVAGFFGQVATSLVKNFRLKKAAPCSTCVEVFLPVLFVVGLIGIWTATSNTDIPNKIFFNATETLVTPADIATLVCVNTTNVNATVGLPFPSCPTLLTMFLTGQVAIPQALIPKAPPQAPPSNVSTTAAPPTSTKAFDPNSLFTCLDNNHLDVLLKGLCTIGLPPEALLLSLAQPLAKAMLIPTLDEMILLKQLGTRFGVSRFLPTLSFYQSIRDGGKIHFIPDRPDVRALVDYLNRTNALFKYVAGNIFKDQAAAKAYRDRGENGRLNWAHVDFTQGSLTAESLAFTIRMNRTVSPSTQLTAAVSQTESLTNEYFMTYTANGFLTIQKAIQDYHASQILGKTTVPVINSSSPTPLDGRLVMARMPTSAYIDQQFVAIASILAPLALIFAFLFGVSQLAKSLVEEKENRLREAMLIMGLSTPAFYASWILTYLAQYTVTSILITILLKATITKKGDGVIIFFLFWLFMFSTIALSTLISSFINRARVASVIAPILFFIIGIPSFTNLASYGKSVAIPLLLLSPSALGSGLLLVFSKEATIGVQSSNMTSQYDIVNMALVFVFLVLDIFWYFLLGFYFDAVLPKDWGAPRHPLFFITEPIAWCRRKDAEDDSEIGVADGRDPNGVYEPEATVRHPSVHVRGIEKTFGSLTAVNKLTFQMYPNEITVLLGHNGAGKTTAINVMTGMLDPDSGDCTIYGKSVVSQLAEVRHSIGFCPQHNILWPQLTCRQHLEFFAKIKGLSAEEADKEATAMLQAVDLMEKADAEADTLSGGQKRKLSVAIAFVGGNRMVFLDEPTAGMDVGARRHTWDLLKSMTAGRTILLTTHYMDEADLLGQRVAIMSKGTLKCNGSPMFLKSRLGVGYALHLAHMSSHEQRAIIEGTVSRHVPNSEKLSAAHGEMVFRLPLADSRAFAPLLRELEDGSENLGIRSIGMGMTTLEEVFIKIGNEEHISIVQHAAASPASSPPPGAVLPPASKDQYTPNSSQAAQPIPEETGSGALPRLEDLNPTFGGQLRALFIKRFHFIRRDYRTLVFQIFIPIIGILVGIGLGSLRDPEPPVMTFTDSIYGSNLQVDVTSTCPTTVRPTWQGRIRCPMCSQGRTNPPRRSPRTCSRPPRPTATATESGPTRAMTRPWCPAGPRWRSSTTPTRTRRSLR